MRFILAFFFIVAFMVTNTIDHDALILDRAQQCHEDEVLVETLAGFDPSGSNIHIPTEHTWVCAPVDNLRPLVGERTGQ